MEVQGYRNDQATPEGLHICMDKQPVQPNRPGCCAYHRLLAESTGRACGETPPVATMVTADDLAGAQWGEALCAGCLAGGRVLAGTGVAAHLVPDAQWEHPKQGCPPAELMEILPIKRSSVLRRRGRRRVPLGSPGTAATLALPSHGVAFCREPEAMPEYPTRHHGIDLSRACRDRGRRGQRHYESARLLIAPRLRKKRTATGTSTEVAWS